jgi:hypothetical protein
MNSMKMAAMATAHLDNPGELDAFTKAWEDMKQHSLNIVDNAICNTPEGSFMQQQFKDAKVALEKLIGEVEEAMK